MASIADSSLEYTSSFPRHASVHDAIQQIVEKVAEDDILVEDEELLIKTLIKILVELGETAAADAVSTGSTPGRGCFHCPCYS